jgi:hypothetical protein
MKMTQDYSRIAVDIWKQWGFDQFMLKKLFSSLQSKFGNITFDYKEDEKRLEMACSIVETPFLSLSEVIKLAEKVFGKGVPMRGFFQTEYQGKKGLEFGC